jgi:hypothetical protein
MFHLLWSPAHINVEFYTLKKTSWDHILVTNSSNETLLFRYPRFATPTQWNREMAHCQSSYVFMSTLKDTIKIHRQPQIILVGVFNWSETRERAKQSDDRVICVGQKPFLGKYVLNWHFIFSYDSQVLSLKQRLDGLIMWDPRQRGILQDTGSRHFGWWRWTDPQVNWIYRLNFFLEFLVNGIPEIRSSMKWHDDFVFNYLK